MIRTCNFDAILRARLLQRARLYTRINPHADYIQEAECLGLGGGGGYSNSIKYVPRDRDEENGLPGSRLVLYSK